MGFENLLLNYSKLIKHMEDEGYSKSYILLLKTEINWLQKNGDLADSYEIACAMREAQTNSPEMRRRYRLEYGILKRFDLEGVYPDYRLKEPLVKYGAYYQLCPEYKEVIDCYKEADSLRGLKPHTIKGNASAGACFLYSMQDKGLFRLSEIDESAAMSFFTDEFGHVALSSGYKKQVAAVFKANLGEYTDDTSFIRAPLSYRSDRRKRSLIASRLLSVLLRTRCTSLTESHVKSMTLSSSTSLISRIASYSSREIAFFL